MSRGRLPTPDHGRATVNVAGLEVLRLGAFSCARRLVGRAVVLVAEFVFW